MKRYLLSIYYSVTCLCVGIIFVACGDSGTKSETESHNNVADYEVWSLSNLPACNSARKGKTAIVMGAKYVCDCRDWVDVEMEQMINEAVNSNRGNSAYDSLLQLYDKTQKILDNLPCSDSYSYQDEIQKDKNENVKSSSSVIDTLIENSIIFSSSSVSEKDSSDYISDELIEIKEGSFSGVAQKGPFLQGSLFRVIPLDGKTLEPVGDTLTGTFKESDGKFSITNLNIPSQYVVIEASGYYFNELSGEKSNRKATIKSIVDVRRGGNVNVLTDLEYERVKYLVLNKEYSVVSAKKQAFSEMLSAFYIKNIDGVADKCDILQDSVSLAISIMSLWLIDNGVNYIESFREQFRENGEWSDLEMRLKMADFAYEARVSGKFNNYRNNVASLKQSNIIPNFEKYINNYWQHEYGLGECSSALDGKIKKNKRQNSKYNDVYFICEKEWRNIEGTECEIVGLILSGNEENGKYFICDNEYYYDNRFKGKFWREATPLEVDKYYTECIADGKLHLFSDGKTYVCEPDSFRIANRTDSLYYVACYEKLGCTKGKEGKFTDLRDGKEYKTISIGNQVWMAENLNYETEDSYCYKDSLVYCNQYGRIYTWNAAKKACPDGWRLPDSTDWRILIDSVGGANVAGKVLKSLDGWNKDSRTFSYGTDAVGFSALPIGQRYANGSYSALGDYAEFWTSSECISSYPQVQWVCYVSFASYGVYASKTCDSNGETDRGHSVRCVKD